MSEQPMDFPPNSDAPPKHIRAVRDVFDGQLYHRDDFECWTATGDGGTFIWETLNVTDEHGRWMGQHLVEVPEFTREKPYWPCAMYAMLPFTEYSALVASYCIAGDADHEGDHVPGRSEAEFRAMMAKAEELSK